MHCIFSFTQKKHCHIKDEIGFYSEKTKDSLAGNTMIVQAIRPVYRSTFMREKVAIGWPRQESNLNLELRKLLYYPLYYEAIILCANISFLKLFSKNAVQNNIFHI